MGIGGGFEGAGVVFEGGAFGEVLFEGIGDVGIWAASLGISGEIVRDLDMVMWLLCLELVCCPFSFLPSYIFYSLLF